MFAIGRMLTMITDVKLTEGSSLKDFLDMVNLLLAQAPDVSSIAIPCAKQVEQSLDEKKTFFLYK